MEEELNTKRSELEQQIASKSDQISEYNSQIQKAKEAEALLAQQRAEAEKQLPAEAEAAAPAEATYPPMASRVLEGSGSPITAPVSTAQAAGAAATRQAARFPQRGGLSR